MLRQLRKSMSLYLPGSVGPGKLGEETGPRAYPAHQCRVSVTGFWPPRLPGRIEPGKLGDLGSFEEWSSGRRFRTSCSKTPDRVQLGPRSDQNRTEFELDWVGFWPRAFLFLALFFFLNFSPFLFFSLFPIFPLPPLFLPLGDGLETPCDDGDDDEPGIRPRWGDDITAATRPSSAG